MEIRNQASAALEKTENRNIFRHTANWIRARLLTPKGPAVGDTLAVHTHVASPPLYRARENIGTHQLSKTSLSLAALCPNSHGPRPKH